MKIYIQCVLYIEQQTLLYFIFIYYMVPILYKVTIAKTTTW